MEHSARSLLIAPFVSVILVLLAGAIVLHFYTTKLISGEVALVSVVILVLLLPMLALRATKHVFPSQWSPKEKTKKKNHVPVKERTDEYWYEKY